MSTTHVCIPCQTQLIVPQYKKRTVEGLDVYSFFAYDEIDILLKTKHTYIGHYVYDILAKHTMAALAHTFKTNERMAVVPIDDRVLHGYSHTAILAHALKSDTLIARYGTLHAKNTVSYSGKSLEYRNRHPRNFTYRKSTHKSVVLVDDIVTTGSTLLQAKRSVQQHNQDVAFAVVLADASR